MRFINAHVVRYEALAQIARLGWLFFTEDAPSPEIVFPIGVSDYTIRLILCSGSRRQAGPPPIHSIVVLKDGIEVCTLGSGGL